MEPLEYGLYKCVDSIDSKQIINANTTIDFNVGTTVVAVNLKNVLADGTTTIMKFELTGTLTPVA